MIGSTVPPPSTENDVEAFQFRPGIVNYAAWGKKWVDDTIRQLHDILCPLWSSVRKSKLLDESDKIFWLFLGALASAKIETGLALALARLIATRGLDKYCRQ